MASDVFTLVTVLLTVALSRAAEDDLGSEIQPGIKLIKKSYTIIAQKNSPLYVNCSVTSNVGIKSFVWKKNGNPIASRSRIKIQENRSLYFREVVHRRKKNRKRNDEGIYECYVENEYGTVLATRVKLQIAGIQTTFLKEPEPLVAYVGGVGSFQCDIKAVPPAVYVWEKDKVQLQNVDRYASLPSGTLQISNVTKSDAGLYRCRSYHGALKLLPDQVDEFQWRISSEAQLTVKEATTRPLRFIRKPANVTAIVGTTVALICIVDGKPAPKIIWSRKDGLKIRTDNVELIAGGNLRLANVRATDNGTYICSAVSSSGQVISAYATLTVYSEPEIFNTFEHRSYPRAYVVDFECKYTGLPIPTIQWLFNGKKVETGSRISILSKEKSFSLLRIVQSQESDSGYYQCLAENEVGYATAVARFKVDVNDKAPNPPQNITVYGSGSMDLKISWTPPIPKTCCPITAYSVHCSEKSGPKRAQLVKVTSLILENLKPYTNYTCYVTAYSEYGASKHSNKVSYVTPDATPLVAPKVEVVSSTHTSIKIKWDKIPSEKSRGIINQYRVYYSTDKGTTMEKFKKPALREYLITELIPSTVYRIRMLAGTIAGFPHLDESSWPWTITKTQSLTRPIETPKNLNVAIQNTSSVVVSWDLDKTVSIDYFVLQLYKVDAPEKKLEFRLPSNLTDYTLNNLENNTFYQVSVNAFSGDDASIQVTKVFQTSSEATVPPAPSIISALPVSSTTVNLTWERPDFSSDIVSYTVRYNPTASKPGETEQYIRTDLTSVSIKNLKPYTEYQFSVRSHSEDEKGPYGKLVIVRTNEGVPSIPTAIHWLLIGSGKVELSWSPPSLSNGIIQSYTILYSSDKESPDSAWAHLIQNGSAISITVENLQKKIYYAKLWANTTAGKGPSSKMIVIDISNPIQPTVSTTPPSSINSLDQSSTVSSRTGIIIGIIVGVLTFIVVIFIFFFVRRRCCMAQNLPLTSHISSNGHVHNIDSTELTGVHELESRTPMLTRLSENENSDAKGGGSLIFTSSGTLINGFQMNSGLNGHVPNGHATSFISACLDKGMVGNNGGGRIEGKAERGGDMQGSEQMEPLLSGSKKHESQPHSKESTAQNIDKENKVESRLELDELNPNLAETDEDATGLNGTNLCSSLVDPSISDRNMSNSATLNSDNTGGLPMGNGPGSSCSVQPVASNLLPNPVVVEGSHHGRANSSCSHPRNGDNQLSSLSSSKSSPFTETSAQSFSKSPSSIPQDVTQSNRSAINSSLHGDQQQQHSSIRTLHQNSTNQHPASTITNSTTTTSGPHSNGDSIITPSTAIVPPPLSTNLTPSSTSMTTSESSDVISTNCSPPGNIGSDTESDQKNTSPKPGSTEFPQEAPIVRSCDLTSDSHGNNNNTASDVVQTKDNRTAINGMNGAPWPNTTTTTTAEDNDLSNSSGSIKPSIPSVTCLPLQNQDSAVGVDQGVV